jgi:divalent metal cation (Fe/Co/Zn/Cd) transporter
VGHGWGIAAAAAGIVGNQLVARYKVVVGRRIRSATMIADAQTVATEVPGVAHAQARARWTGRTLRVEVEGFLAHDTRLADADLIGRRVAAALTPRILEMRSFTWTARCV